METKETGMKHDGSSTVLQNKAQGTFSHNYRISFFFYPKSTLSVFC